MLAREQGGTVVDGPLAQDEPVSVEINDLIWVGLPDEQNSLMYRSRVEDMKDDRVIVAWPTDAGVRIPIREQQRLAVAFARQDAVYSFSAVVEDRSQVPIPQLALRPTGCCGGLLRQIPDRGRIYAPR